MYVPLWRATPLRACLSVVLGLYYNLQCANVLVLFGLGFFSCPSEHSRLLVAETESTMERQALYSRILQTNICSSLSLHSESSISIEQIGCHFQYCDHYWIINWYCTINNGFCKNKKKISLAWHSVSEMQLQNKCSVISSFIFAKTIQYFSLLVFNRQKQDWRKTQQKESWALYFNASA